MTDVVGVTSEAQVRSLAEGLVRFLECGTPPAGLFHADVFVDFTLPLWRLQALGADAAVALRRHGHPAAGEVPRRRVDPTPTGFVLEVEERWTDGGQEWCCRELMRADVTDGAISTLAVYCTGDWDEACQARHAREVELIRP